MNRHTRLAAAMLLVAGSVGGLGLMIGTSATRPGPARADPPAESVDHVVVVGVAGLHWSDVNRMPTLLELTREGSAGTLSARSAADVTCPVDGWLTLGAGGYATAGDPRDTSGAGCAGRLPPPVAGTGPAVPSMAELRDRNDVPRIGTSPGLLGERLSCVTAIGPGAALAAADPAGDVDHYLPTLPDEDTTAALARCPFTTVDLGTAGGDRTQGQQALGTIDDAIARLQGQLPPRSLLIVLGVAESDPDQPRLQVVVAHGPGFEAGWLRSTSTRRLPYAQLVDVAPTVLAVLGEAVPDALAGRPLAGGVPGRPDRLPANIAELVDTDTRAVAQRTVVGRFFGSFGAALLLVVIGSTVLLIRQRRALPTPPGMAQWLGRLTLALAAVPGATFLANLVPWWRAATPTLAVAATTAVGALAMTALAIAAAVLLPSRWGQRWPAGASGLPWTVAALSATTVAVFIIDALTGARLQIDGRSDIARWWRAGSSGSAMSDSRCSRCPRWCWRRSFRTDTGQWWCGAGWPRWRCR